ncbi:MAG: hypothetical protein IKU37_01885 [Candidatus Gastranaerophilales bacterium]|nr:hypothetical protein [Candidatus Gastranaerophilales bacterium]
MMKIIDEYYSEKEILTFVATSTSVVESNFKVISVEEKHGWAYIKVQNNEKVFFIKFSSLMFDVSILIKCFNEVTYRDEEIAIFLDYEGSYPLIYLKPRSDSKIRFLFAHDYDLFLRDDINDYSLNDYKIECDVVLDGEMLLKEFLKVLNYC